MLRAGLFALWLALLVPPAQAAQTLRIGMQADPATLDPAQSASFVDRVALAAVCDKLVDLDPGMRFTPHLATEWSWGDDGKSLTMRLRSGVLFHDGTPLDAQAVKANLDRYRTADYSSRKSEVKSVADVVVVDPPRAGLSKKVVRRLIECEPERIVYVSCNPTTLAPNAAQLEEAGYTLRRVKPVDMFPQTPHIECVALLEKTA